MVGVRRRSATPAPGERSRERRHPGPRRRRMPEERVEHDLGGPGVRRRLGIVESIYLGDEAEARLRVGGRIVDGTRGPGHRRVDARPTFRVRGVARPVATPHQFVDGALAQVVQLAHRQEQPGREAGVVDRAERRRACRRGGPVGRATEARSSGALGRRRQRDLALHGDLSPSAEKTALSGEPADPNSRTSSRVLVGADVLGKRRERRARLGQQRAVRRPQHLPARVARPRAPRSPVAMAPRDESVRTALTRATHRCAAEPFRRLEPEPVAHLEWRRHLDDDLAPPHLDHRAERRAAVVGLRARDVVAAGPSAVHARP